MKGFQERKYTQTFYEFCLLVSRKFYYNWDVFVHYSELGKFSQIRNKVLCPLQLTYMLLFSELENSNYSTNVTGKNVQSQNSSGIDFTTF